MNKTRQYVVLTAMRNEASTVEITLKSVTSQTELPLLWIIIDDGSADGSGEIVRKYTELYKWINIVTLPDRGYDLVGKGVADILNYGLTLIGETDIEYLSKIDADLEFDVDYFERMMNEMEKDRQLGIISGIPYIKRKNKKVFSQYSNYFPSGAARLYRYYYLKDIGSFAGTLGWDTIDILRMQLRGYATKIFRDVPIHHLRPMGTRQGYFDGMTRDGRNNYITGYSRLFFFLRALYNAKHYPYLIRTLCMVYGYILAWWRKLPLAVTEEEHLLHVNLQRRRLGLKSIDKI